MRRWGSMHTMHPSRCAHAGFTYPVRSLGVAFVATRSPVPHWTARTWRGATPPADALVRGRGRARFTRPPPPPGGVAPFQISLAGRPSNAAASAADHRIGPVFGSRPLPGRLDPAADLVCQRRLGHLVRMIRLLGRPVAKARPTAVRGRSPMNTSSTLSATLVHPSAYYAT